jgi:hypothetical protein
MDVSTLILFLVLTAIGSFAGGCLFGLRLSKRFEEKATVKSEPKKVYAGKEDSIPPGRKLTSADIIGEQVRKQRIGWPALKRQLEEEDPEARRYEEIMNANSGAD